MRNFLAGLAGAIWAACILLWLSETPIPSHLYPYGLAAPILTGLELLSQTPSMILEPSQTLLIIAAWLIVGAVAGPFSEPGWNLLRSSFWSGVIVTLAAIVAGGAVFWVSADRNITIALLFFGSAISAQLSLLSATPIAYLLKTLTRKKERPVPTLIETVCECGARFRSNPLICSECGRRLRNDEGPLLNR